MNRQSKIILVLIILSLGHDVRAYPMAKIDTLIDFTVADSIAVHKEIKLLNKLLANREFWIAIKKTEFFCTNQRVYHAKRKRKSVYPKQKKDKHPYTSNEIHGLLWFGQDEIGGEKDEIIDLKLRAKDYPKNKNGSQTHGSTNSGSLIISSDRKTRIHSKIKGKYAAHLLHEYMHVLGFKHKSNSPSKNLDKCGGIDVPLGIQKIAERIFKS